MPTAEGSEQPETPAEPQKLSAEEKAQLELQAKAQREQIEKEAFSAFDTAIASVRSSLTKAGHLELVTSEGYRAAQKQLIETVGRRPAELFLNNWFARNGSN